MTKIAASQRQEVANLCISGKGVANVAVEYGVTRACIASILRGLGVQLTRGPKVSERKPRGPNARDLAMAAMHKEGSTLQEIGTEYGVTRERVRQILSMRFGITKIDGGGAVRSFKNTSAKVDSARAKTARQEAYWRAIWDMSLDDYRAHVSAYGSSLVASSPMHKYVQQRNNARKRGIDWNFTFPEWWGVWQESGRWPERGLGKDLYVMARYGDGDVPYSVGTVYVCTQSQNVKDGYIVSPYAERFANSPSRVGAGIGYTHVKRNKTNPYTAQFRGKAIGSFPTPELARAAYLAAAEQYKATQPAA